MKELFTSKYGLEIPQRAIAFSLNEEFAPKIQERMDYYNSAGSNVDGLSAVKNQIEDVKGVVRLDMAENRILIPKAFIDSEKIDIGAKAIIKDDLSDGVIYARYKKLDFVVKFKDGKRNIDLLHARGKFDEYQLPVVTK